jgi:CDGSH-type Zn-finger protein
MSTPIRIRCRENGSLVVEGPVVVVDHLGNPFPLPTNKPNIALCRCGVSATKPFCDGSHRQSGFVAQELAPLPADPTPPPAE